MVIIGAKRSSLTRWLMRQKEFKVKPNVLFNLGLSNCDCRGYNKVINKPEAVRANADKLVMLRKLKNANVCRPLVISKASDALMHIEDYNGIVAKPGNTFIKSERMFYEYMLHNTPDYFTEFIPHDKEFRVIIYNDRLVKLYEKIRKPDYTGDLWKIENCEFKERRWEDFPGLVTVAKSAVKAVGLDLCGVDIIRAMDGKYVVLETNSAPGMHENTLRKLVRMDSDFSMKD